MSLMDTAATISVCVCGMRNCLSPTLNALDVVDRASAFTQNEVQSHDQAPRLIILLMNGRSPNFNQPVHDQLQTDWCQASYRHHRLSADRTDLEDKRREVKMIQVFVH